MLLYLLHTYTSSKHEWDFKAVDCCACVEILKRLTERELEVLYLVAASKVPNTPLFSRWPEQSVSGQQTVVSGHLEFSLKTTAT